MTSNRTFYAPLRALIMSQSEATPRYIAALSHAGWIVIRDVRDGILSPEIALLICEAEEIDRLGAEMSEVLLASTGTKHSRADFSLTGQESENILADLWRLPRSDQLDRMGQTFGRASITPLLEGLRVELRKAVADLAERGFSDAHKLTGLSGMLGFTDVSQAWHALDQENGSVDDARLASRIAIATINCWLSN